jgi:hypothetical protein
MSEHRSTPEFARAIPALTDTAERLEAEGFTPAQIADAMLSLALTLGTNLTSPATTAKMLSQMAQSFAKEAQQSAAAVRH